MNLDNVHVLLLGALLAVTLTLVAIIAFGLGALAWAWSWSSRFDSLGANREEDGTVALAARLKPKQVKKTKPRMIGPSNGVRNVPVVRGEAS